MVVAEIVPKLKVPGKVVVTFIRTVGDKSEVAVKASVECNGPVLCLVRVYLHQKWWKNGK